MVDVDLRPKKKKRKKPKAGKGAPKPEEEKTGFSSPRLGGLGKVLFVLILLMAAAFLGYQYWTLRMENERLRLQLATMKKPKVIEKERPLQVQDLSLQGIATGAQGTILFLRDPQGRDYLLRLGDVLAGYVLEHAEGDSLILRSGDSVVVLKLEMGS